MTELEKLQKTQEFMERVPLTGKEVLEFVQCMAQLKRIEQQLATKAAITDQSPTPVT